jgi:hypothetical protein
MASEDKGNEKRETKPSLTCFLRVDYIILHVNNYAMDTKLTLSLDKTVIGHAKAYAKSHKISLSKLIESYLSSLVSNRKTTDFEITPLVKSLSGVIKMEEDFNYKEEYLASIKIN